MVFASVMANETTQAPVGTQWDEDVATALRTYVANPLFRAADVTELEIVDNPYRRPVRPDDLEWLSFDEPITAATTSRLSALLGHRMLLNIYDSHHPFLPQHMTEERWRDFDLYYGAANRLSGERVRPFLEQHLFGFVRGDGGTDDADRALDGLSADRAAAAQALADRLGSVRDLEQAARMVVTQLLGRSLAAARVSTWHAEATELSDRVSVLAQRFELIEEPHRYYQFYLPTTLALMNYVVGAGEDPFDIYLAAGALAAERADLGARLAVLERAVGVAGAGPVARPAVPRLVTESGAPAEAAFCRGVAEYLRLAAVHDKDLDRQLVLVDGRDEHIAKAHRLYDAINTHHIQVDLDTFVETSDECSTTHVHDDDRLVVIESGEMEFWTCPGQRVHLTPGDCFFVPMHRLHGSVVRSGTCVYHQPVITPELDRRFAGGVSRSSVEAPELVATPALQVSSPRAFLVDQQRIAPPGAPAWLQPCIDEFVDNVGDPAYPCHFGRLALQAGDLHGTWLGAEDRRERSGADTRRVPRRHPALSASPRRTRLLLRTGARRSRARVVRRPVLGDVARAARRRYACVAGRRADLAGRRCVGVLLPRHADVRLHGDPDAPAAPQPTPRSRHGRPVPATQCLPRSRGRHARRHRCSQADPGRAGSLGPGPVTPGDGRLRRPRAPRVEAVLHRRPRSGTVLRLPGNDRRRAAPARAGLGSGRTARPARSPSSPATARWTYARCVTRARPSPPTWYVAECAPRTASA